MYPVSLPEYTAHEQQMWWHAGRVKQCRAVWSHAGQESSCASTAVLRGTAEPQTPQIRTGPLTETHSWNQLRGQGWLSFTGTPLLNYHRGHCGVTKRKQLKHKHRLQDCHTGKNLCTSYCSGVCQFPLNYVNSLLNCQHCKSKKTPKKNLNSV